MRIAHANALPPFAEMKDGRSCGLVVEIVRAAVERAGGRVELVPLQFEDMEQALASGAAGMAPASMRSVSFTASTATMRSPRPPAPTKAATVAVPTLMTAAVDTPASTVGSASGSCTRRSTCASRRPRAHAASVSPVGTPASPAWVLRAIGSSA